MAWSINLLSDGRYTLKIGGIDVGLLSFMPQITQQSVRAGLVADAMNRLDRNLSTVYTDSSWIDAAEHDRELAAIRVVVQDEGDEVVEEVRRRWESSGLSLPMTRRQMARWTDVCDEVIADHRQVAP